MLREEINADLKNAMLSGDKSLVEVLKGLKSAIQYAAVEKGVGSDLSEQEIIAVLKSEQKKRLEAIKLYQQANEANRVDKENYEKGIINKYLPPEMSQSEVLELVDKAISEFGEVNQKNMGLIISSVKKASGGAADGSTVAKIVKERL